MPEQTQLQDDLAAYQDSAEIEAALANIDKSAGGTLSVNGNKKPTLGKVRYSHDAMIDCIIAEPTVTQNKLSEIFDRTPAWISIVVNSDAFKSRLALRKDQIVNPLLLISTEERFRAVTNRSLELLSEKLEKNIVSDALVLKAIEIGAKALGVGGNAPPAPPVSPDYLEKLSSRLLALNSRAHNPGVIHDVEAYEILPASRADVRPQDGAVQSLGPEASDDGDFAQAASGPWSGQGSESPDPRG